MCKNKPNLATVGTSKENGYLRAFGWNRNWLIPWECDRNQIYSTYFEGKCYWVTPLFKSRNISTFEWWRYPTMRFSQTFELFFQIFFSKMINYNISRKKKHKVPWKRPHYVTPLFKSRDTALLALPEGNVFAELSFFFRNIFLQNMMKYNISSIFPRSRTKRGTGLGIGMATIYRTSIYCIRYIDIQVYDISVYIDIFFDIYQL